MPSNGYSPRRKDENAGDPRTVAAGRSSARRQRMLVAIEHPREEVVETLIEAPSPSGSALRCRRQRERRVCRAVVRQDFLNFDFVRLNLMRLDPACAKQRHHRHGDEVGGEQRENDRERQRGEQKPAHAVEKDHREEDDRGGERGGQHGQLHFRAAFLRGDLRRLAHLQVAENVFEHDHGVVDQARERQRQTAQDHAY